MQTAVFWGIIQIKPMLKQSHRPRQITLSTSSQLLRSGWMGGCTEQGGRTNVLHKICFVFTVYHGIVQCIACIVQF